MGWHPPDALSLPQLAVHVGVGYFVDVGNQKSIWVQVAIDGYLRLTRWQHPKITQPRSARSDYVKGETVLLPKLATIWSSHRWAMPDKYVCQRLEIEKAL